ncbi:histidine phosphatase family protein [Cohnella pontilimi]|uniref:Histidine phosphatase family protein n=1 Tax=Cohnella pontilimi TaxID=2564100 RepID=A0A4U0F8Y7_9BACL|nr:histidine phosphatase family protein [Cohnella pontilimi]TJY41101.1 histidine phosphatase family protein [Cohnella pontilimi]
MSANFYLVRHAIKEKAIGDVPIAKEGVAQAQATARYFRSLPVQAVLCSPLRRAKDTAAFIAAVSFAPVSEDIRLRERANWGDLPGQSFDEFVAMWDRCTRERDFLPPVGDSARRAGERLSACLMELAESSRYDSAFVVVTHGGLITDFLVNEFSEEELDFWQPQFIIRQSSLIPECSITKLIYKTGCYQIEMFASVNHLSSP